MSNTTITKTAFFAVPPEKVWDFLTKKDKLAGWFHPAEKDLAADEDYSLGASSEDGSWSKIIWGTVLHWEPPAKLIYTFNIAPLNGIETTVTWNLEASHGGTMLSLKHEGVGNLGDKALGLLMALDDGWDEHIGRLRGLLKSEDHVQSDCADH
jgi:uncharacterized protein YndB with AHSA1/START domain